MKHSSSCSAHLKKKEIEENQTNEEEQKLYNKSFAWSPCRRHRHYRLEPSPFVGRSEDDLGLWVIKEIWVHCFY